MSQARTDSELPFQALPGRHAELELLDRELRRAQAGEGRFIALVGEAGIGKTRLLQEAARRSGMRTLDLYGLPERLSTEDLLEAWCVPLLSGARRGIEALDLSIAAAAYPRLAGLDPVAGADPPPKVTHVRGLAAVARLITHAAERDPLLFLVDDLPRMRSEARAFVAEMAAVLAHARLAFLITARHDPAAPEASDPLRDRALAPVIERHLVRRIDVQPLEEAGLRELIAAELDLGIVPALLPWLAAKTGGNPLFAIELLRALEGQGLLYVDHMTGSWLLGGQLTEVGLPETISHVLDSRRRLLPPELAHPLPALALLGPDAPTVLLARVLAMDPAAVGDLRRRLTRAGVLTRRGEAHAFSHPLMAENWARELDPKERRRLLVEAIDLDLEAIGGREGVIRGGRRRGSCATGLESALDDELARIIAYAGALDRDHDASYPLAALELGRRSLVGQGPRAAEHWARRAARRVARVRSKGQRRWLRGQIDLLLGNALYQKGRLPAAEARFRRFLRTPEARDPQRGIGAFTALGQLLIKSAQPDEARRVLEEGRAALMDAPAEPGVLMASAEILCYLARIEMSRDELDLAAGLLEQASATLGDLHADPQVAEVAEAKERILVERALLSMRRGDLRKGIQGFEELLALGRHRPRDNASRLANLALYLALVGDLRRARPLALEALRAGRRMQDAYAASFRWVCLGLIEAIAGNWQLAVGAHRRARQLSEHGRDPGTWHLSTGELARAAQVLEGSEASDRLWHEAMRGSSVAGRPSRGHLFHLYWSRAWALLRRRDWKGALAASAQAAALVGANPRNHAVVELTALEAEVRLELEAAHEAGGTGRTRAENLARLASRLDSVEPYLREQLVRQELVNLARLRLYLILAGWRGARPEALIAEVESQLLEMNAPALMAEVAEEFSGTAVAALPRFQHAFEREQCKQPAAEAAAVELLSPDEPQHLLRVLALGRLKVFRCGESEPLTRSDWGSKKARILLAYLLAEDLEGRGVARDALLEAAWADDDSLTIEHTFGVTMTLLRKALGSARSGAGARLLLFADGVYRLDFSAVWCDCRAFEQALREAATCERNREPEQALEFRRQAFDLYQGEFLADFDEVWIDPRRERYRRRFLEIGGQLTEEALRVGDLGEAQEVAERLVSCDPLSEAAHHLLVRAYAAAGRHDAATRQRERCRALQKQFGAGDGRDLE